MARPFSAQGIFLHPLVILSPSCCGFAFYYEEGSAHCTRTIPAECGADKAFRLDALNPCCSVADSVGSASAQGIVLLLSAPGAGGAAYTPVKDKER